MSGLFERAGLEAQGVQGFASVAALEPRGAINAVPVDPGAYVVFRLREAPPVFIDPGSGGWFKGRDPNVRTETLRDNWVVGANVVYIGKATSLRSRVGQLIKFGHGSNIGHQGGRYLWQLADAFDLLVAWQGHPDPSGRETALIEAFVDDYGTFPFANLRW